MPSTSDQPPFEAYRGREPYVFVSYAHKDSAIVFPELVRLAGMGVNIWYDEGIDPGNEWPDEIADALDRASMFLFFVTPQSAASINCRNEVNYSLNKDQDFLAVHLEETELPRGLNLRIGSLQAVMKFRMTEDGYERKMGKCLELFIQETRGTAEGIKIALIDSGVELGHPALKGLSLSDDLAFELQPDGVVAMIEGEGIDVFGHGTALASIIRNSSPAAQLGSFRVLNKVLGSKFDVIDAAVNAAMNLKYDIICCGFGSSNRERVLWPEDAFMRGIHVVAGCNSVDSQSPEYPASLLTVIGVNMANTTSDDLFYRSGSKIRFAAKGVDLDVPWKRGQTKKQSGSSFAAAHVAGLLACQLSKTGSVTPMEAILLMQRKATPWVPGLAAPNDVKQD